MSLQYLLLPPVSELPDISILSPYRAVVVIEAHVSNEWKWRVSTWLVKTGCMYMMAWGIECSSWDDSVDEASIMEYIDLEQRPDDKLIMTTWHNEWTLEETFVFSKNCAAHPTVEISNTLIIHISDIEKLQEFLNIYEKADLYH